MQNLISYDRPAVFQALQSFKKLWRVDVSWVASYRDPALIVRSQHDFYDIWQKKKSHGDGRETATAQLEIVGTPHGHSTGSVRFSHKVLTSLRSLHGFVSEKMAHSTSN